MVCWSHSSSQAVWRVKTTLKEEVSTQCPKLFGVALILPDFALWLVQKTRATLSTNQMQTKTNHNLVARVFPRLRQLGCFCIEFSLALIGNFLPPDWPLLLFWFEFYDTQLKSALWGKKPHLPWFIVVLWFCTWELLRLLWLVLLINAKGIYK